MIPASYALSATWLALTPTAVPEAGGPDRPITTEDGTVTGHLKPSCELLCMPVTLSQGAEGVMTLVRPSDDGRLDEAAFRTSLSTLKAMVKNGPVSGQALAAAGFRPAIVYPQSVKVLNSKVDPQSGEARVSWTADIQPPYRSGRFCTTYPSGRFNVTRALTPVFIGTLRAAPGASDPRLLEACIMPTE